MTKAEKLYRLDANLQKLIGKTIVEIVCNDYTSLCFKCSDGDRFNVSYYPRGYIQLEEDVQRLENETRRLKDESTKILERIGRSGL